jgi:hypothetical protein
MPTITGLNATSQSSRMQSQCRTWLILIADRQEFASTHPASVHLLALHPIRKASIAYALTKMEDASLAKMKLARN